MLRLRSRRATKGPRNHFVVRVSAWAARDVVQLGESGKNLTLLPRRSFSNGGAAFSQFSSKHALGFVLHLSLT
jgi:hypothetical protein